MNPVSHAVRIGLGRGWTEFRQSLRRYDEQFFNVIVSIVILIVLYFQRGTAVPGTTLPLATVALPGILGM